jgi:hypothetical protein
MPCCKKWCFYRPDQPLYYQDDNGPCYVYAYADQMVADAWLALDDSHRLKLAPCFASFDPTDLAAIAHVKRMHSKYPKMWRGIGEVMCRHDDLTTMLLGKEIPRINHPVSASAQSSHCHTRTLHTPPHEVPRAAFLARAQYMHGARTRVLDTCTFPLIVYADRDSRALCGAAGT